MKNKNLMYLGVAVAAYLLLSKKESVAGIEGMDYYTRQLENIDASNEYGVKIKITDAAGNSTNFINLNKDSVAALKNWLKKNNKNWK
jgi:hypothetical protein